MRSWRVAAVFTVVAVLALGAAWRGAASQTGLRSAAVPRFVPGAPTLQRALQQYLAQPPFLGPRFPQTPRGVPIPLPVLPGVPRVCAVAADRCSLVPCVEFAQAGVEAVAAPVSSGVVLRQPTAGPLGPGQGAGSGCRGRLGTPRILRVSMR